jgi:outer membrane protein OmpA-like peptidoglycan-associated protein/tetratricopeptide (TPR) repeat protein
MRKITTTTLLLVAVFLLSGTAFGQKPEKVDAKTAMFEFENGNWEKSKQMYLELLKTVPNDQELNLYCGISFLNSRIDADKSLDYFNKVDETLLPGVIVFKAEAFHYVGEFDSAKYYYEKYLNLDDNKMEKGLVSDINKRIEQCNTGIEFSKNPSEGMFVENLGSDVNTTFVDYAPVVYEDLKTLAFTSTITNLFTIQYMTYQEKGGEEIFYTNYDPVYKMWLPRSKADGVVLNKNIESEGNESSITYSKDLKRFYFYREGGLWVSENLGDPVLTDIKAEGFKEKSIVSIVISRDEETVFVVSDKSGGKGGTDIYMSEKDSDGKWGAYVNLSINTEADETSPFLSGDGKTLYFASNGYNTMGEYDIFMSTKTDSGFANVQNMGIPVNSSANDIHFRLTGGNEEFGYLASDRIGGQGDYDIWRFWTCFDVESTNLNGEYIAKNVTTEKATVSLLTTDSVSLASSDLTQNGGKYTFKVTPDTDYILELNVEGRADQFFNVYVPEMCLQYDLYQLLEMELVKDENGQIVEQKTALTNAFYDIDKARGEQTSKDYVASLTPSSPQYSQPELQVTEFEQNAVAAALPTPPVVNADGKKVYPVMFDFDKADVSTQDKDLAIKLAKGLVENPSSKVVVTGHADSKGPAGYNQKLSVRRAQAVANILMKNGVKSSQITVVGYGETQLKIKDTDANGEYVPELGAQNRRVEMQIQ